MTSFATEGVLKDALSIVKANEHFKVNSQFFVATPRILPSRSLQQTQRLLAFVKARNAHINEALVFLPTVLADMVADYLPASTD